VSDPLAYLLGLEQFGIKFGLGNIEAILGALEHPERAYRSIHIAGTNGKGSVTAMVEAALRAAGHRTGRYTSPHLVSLTERFGVDGQPIDEGELVEVAAHVRDLIEKLLASGTLEVHPTFFEATTAIAFEIFRRRSVDVAVIEVGLGGRLDATNVLHPVATAITSIGFDHEQYLGHSLGAIAREKAGIVKPAVPVVVGEMPAEAFDAIRAQAALVNAPLVRAREGVDVRVVDRESGRITMRTPAADYGELKLALRGAHQIENAIVAVRLLEVGAKVGLAVPSAAIARGLSEVRWPGRLELRTFPDGRSAILDAAHNPEGAAALASYLAAVRSAPLPIVFAAMRDKNVAEILRTLAPVASLFVLTRASTARSADPAALESIARRQAPDTAAVAAPTLASALARAWEASPTIVVAGSIFLLGDAYREWDGPAARS